MQTLTYYYLYKKHSCSFFRKINVLLEEGRRGITIEIIYKKLITQFIYRLNSYLLANFKEVNML